MPQTMQAGVRRNSLAPGGRAVARECAMCWAGLFDIVKFALGAVGPFWPAGVLGAVANLSRSATTRSRALSPRNRT